MSRQNIESMRKLAAQAEEHDDNLVENATAFSSGWKLRDGTARTVTMRSRRHSTKSQR